MKRANLFKILFSVTAFWMLPLAAAGCDAFNPLPEIERHYLLEGEATADEDQNFVYYHYTSVEGDSSISGYAIGLTEYGKSNGNLPALPTTYTNGSTPITGIWHNGFHGAKDKTIELGDNIKYIDFEAFLYSKIETFIIPNSVEKIGDGAFYACPNLKSLYFGAPQGGADDCACDPSPTLGSPQVTVIPSFCFFKCSQLTNVTLPSTLTTIEPEAFNGCSRMQSTLLMPSIKTIRSRSFQACSSLKKVYIGSSMVAADNQATSKPGIEPHAFQYCDPDLQFIFYGTDANITAWQNNHQNWGWYNDADPASNRYSITERKTSGSLDTSLWTAEIYPAGSQTIKITKYNGVQPETFISIPDQLEVGNVKRNVIRIANDVFDANVKSALKRIYLPTTLLAIEHRMFDNAYTNLTVIADNTQCELDSMSSTDFTNNGRIDLSGIENLEFIGDVAFADMAKRDKVKELHLPARLIAVGSSAFGFDQQRHFKNITNFKWDYIDPGQNNGVGSRLEVVGSDAFLKLGSPDNQNQTNFTTIVKYNGDWDPATIIFPKNFSSFGITNANKDKWNETGHPSNPFTFGISAGINVAKNTARNADRPAHIFAGSPLIEKVIFKGGDDSANLLLPLQTFVANTNLHTIIFEERPGKAYTFHTQWNSFFNQQTIGSSGGDGGGKTDFSSTRMLQTIILPNKSTKLRFQEYSFFGNARAAMYFSGSLDSEENIVANAHTGAQWPTITWDNSSLASDISITNNVRWNIVGDESYSNTPNVPGYHGYCFRPNDIKPEYEGDDLNSFDINQKIPYYQNIHFKETVKDLKDHDVEVEVGSGNTNELVITGKCAYVCEQKSGVTSLDGTKSLDGIATMSKYLYDMHNGDLGTATIPEIIETNNKKYQVQKIGPSAFSACYCDGGLNNNNEYPTSKGYSASNDLCRIIMPDSIQEIGDYAFFRAYNLTEISTSSTAGSYLMPKGLKKIGKSAFTFSRVAQVLGIPYYCVLYENTSEATVKTPCAFVNDFNLRKITFLNEAGNEVNQSHYYKVTGNGANGTYSDTTALYSLDVSDTHATDDGFVFNKNKLMVVLYRQNDLDKTSEEVSSNGSENTFDNSSGSFIFGAYKMAFWIHNLKIGTAPDVGRGQPLFSGICNRNSSGVITEKPIYLNNPADNYSTNNGSHKCNLKTITGAILSLPKYACNGCEQLTEVKFPVSADASIPDGLFANNSEAVKYYVEGASKPSDSMVDLTTSGYSGIGKDTFKANTGITKFIAPTRTDRTDRFTIGEGAFQGCTGLTGIDLSNVSNGALSIGKNAFQGCTNLTTITFGNGLGGTLTIGESAFSGCNKITKLDFSGVKGGSITFNKNAFSGCTSILNINWPSDPNVTINIQNVGSFSGCTSLTAIELPTNTSATLGESLFSGCTSLASVKVAGDGASPVTTISSSAFKGCTALNEFEFTAFTNINQPIGASAFENTGTLVPSGAVVLPSNWSNIGNYAFKNTKMTSLKLESTSSLLTLGEESFANNGSLTKVEFNSGCTFASYDTSGIFKGCTNLETILLPSSFVQPPKGKLTFFVGGDTNVGLILNSKHADVSSFNENEDWTWIVGTDHAPVYYFVETLDDVLDPEGRVLIGTSTSYWARIDGEIVLLGTSDSYLNGVVTFSSGWTLDSGSFHRP